MGSTYNNQEGTDRGDRMRRTCGWICLLAVLLMTISGCRLVRVEEEPRTPLEYTVVNPEEVPEEVQELIQERKSKEFQMTYQNEKDLYLIKGYGQQMCGGYSIQVEELGLSSNSIFFKTKLLGPDKDGREGEPSYPNIVVKMEYRKEPVQFDRG